MDDFKNFTEYTVKKKIEGSYLAKHILYYAGYTVIPVALCLAILCTPLISLFYALIPMILASACALAYYTFRFIDVEYEYSLNGERLTVSRIYGKKSRKEWLTADLTKAETFAPYGREGFERYTELADRFEANNIYHAESSVSAPDVFFITYTNDKNESCIVYLEPTEKFLGIAKTYCRNSLVYAPVEH